MTQIEHAAGSASSISIAIDSATGRLKRAHSLIVTSPRSKASRMYRNTSRGFCVTAGENIQCNQSQVGIGMRGTMALIQHDYGSKTWRRIIPKLVPDLGNYRRTGLFRSPCHYFQHPLVIQAYFPGNIATVDQKVFAFVQLINPPICCGDLLRPPYARLLAKGRIWLGDGTIQCKPLHRTCSKSAVC